MKIIVKYKIIINEAIVDLEDYGYDPSTSFSDLSEEEKLSINDNLIQEAIESYCLRVDVADYNK